MRACRLSRAGSGSFKGARRLKPRPGPAGHQTRLRGLGRPLASAGVGRGLA